MKKILLIILLFASIVQAQWDVLPFPPLKSEKVYPPYNLTATIGIGTITINWTNVIREGVSYDSLYVFRGTSTNPSTIIDTIPYGTTYIDSVTPEVWYYYRLKGKKGTIVSDYSDNLYSYAYPDTTGYWVDGATGNDANSGSYFYPYKTLTKAKTVATGSVVHIRAGTYKETSVLTISNGIEFIGMGTVIVQNTSTYAVQTSGATTKIFRNIIFDAEGSLAYTAHCNGGITEFYNCTFKNSASYNFFVANTNDSVLVDGCTFADTVANYMMSLRDKCRITNSTFTGDLNTALLAIASNTDTVWFTNNTVNVKFPQGFVPSSNAHIYIQDNTITIPQNIVNLFDDGVQTAGSITITGNTISTAYNSSDDLITIIGSSGIIATVSNNIFNITSASFTKKLIYISNLECVISGNTITTNSETNTSPKINVVSTGTDIDGKVGILNNTIYDRSIGGYSIAVGTENTGTGDNLIDSVVVKGNTIYGLGYYRESSYDSLGIHSLMVGFNRNAVITQNKVYGGGYGIVLKGSVTAYTSGGVYYNLFVNCVQGIRAKAVQGLNIYNNTVYNNLNYQFKCVYLTENTGSDGSTITTIKNNILITGSTDLDYCIWADSASAVGLVSDYNLLINSAGDVGRLNETEYDFTEWQTATYDANGLNVDPEFTSATDFTLQATSDCINAGVDVGLTVDILGNPIAGNPDIGAYEKQP